MVLIKEKKWVGNSLLSCGLLALLACLLLAGGGIAEEKSVKSVGSEDAMVRTSVAFYAAFFRGEEDENPKPNPSPSKRKKCEACKGTGKTGDNHFVVDCGVCGGDGWLDPEDGMATKNTCNCDPCTCDVECNCEDCSCSNCIKKGMDYATAYRISLENGKRIRVYTGESSERAEYLRRISISDGSIFVHDKQFRHDDRTEYLFESPKPKAQQQSKVIQLYDLNCVGGI